MKKHLLIFAIAFLLLPFSGCDDASTKMRDGYPKEFFDLPDGAVIMTTYFHFSNADKSIVIMDIDDQGDDVDFMLVESCE